MDRRAFLQSLITVGLTTAMGVPPLSAAPGVEPQVLTPMEKINTRRLVAQLKENVIDDLLQVVDNGMVYSDAREYVTTAGLTNATLQLWRKTGWVTDYMIIADETRNTPDMIDRGAFGMSVYVREGYAELPFCIDIALSNRGISFEEALMT